MDKLLPGTILLASGTVSRVLIEGLVSADFTLWLRGLALLMIAAGLSLSALGLREQFLEE